MPVFMLRTPAGDNRGQQVPTMGLFYSKAVSLTKVASQPLNLLLLQPEQDMKKIIAKTDFGLISQALRLVPANKVFFTGTVPANNSIHIKKPEN